MDEIPCVIILLLLRGLVPRMTKVSNAVDAAVKDEEYALRALASDRAKRRMHQDMSFDGEQDPFGMHFSFVFDSRSLCPVIHEALITDVCLHCTVCV